MRLGVFGPWLEPWSSARSTWQNLEQMGFDVAYLGDHLTHPALKGRWISDAYSTLAAVAQVTTRLELGTLVASTVIRAPAPLARVAATLQDLSGGRFVLGVGAGVPGDEEVVWGTARRSEERFQIFTETVEAVTALWSGASSWSGGHVRVEGVGSPSARAWSGAASPDDQRARPSRLRAGGETGGRVEQLRRRQRRIPAGT